MIGLVRRSLSVLAAVFVGSWASAQTAANISVVSGNGQVVCPSCTSSPMHAAEPFVVLVTDSQGNPVSAATVNWSITAGALTGASLNQSQTTTGTDGTTSNLFTVPFQSTIFAYTVVAALPNTAASVTFSLIEGPPETSTQHVFATIIAGPGGALTGSAGGTGATNIQVKVQDFLGDAIANVSVRLAPAPGSSPAASVSCATGAGADLGSALSDNTGVATCTPVFGPIPGNGSYVVLVGGVANAQQNGTGPLGYLQFNNSPINIQVSPGTPSSMKIISGSPQSANAGQSLPAALVAEVDSSSGSALAGEAVTWTVTPSTAAILSNTTTTTDNSGRVSTNVALTTSASGTVQVVASVSSSISVTFTINVNVVITGLTKASGDGQTAVTKAAFAQPLVVQVNAASGQAAANVPIQFAITGPGTLSATSVASDSNGRAAVTVTAGSTAGAITVTASFSTYSVSFGLTVSSPGPAITSSSFVNGAGFFATDQFHAALSPCGIGTVMGSGIAPNVQGAVTGGTSGALPYQLAQVTISFGNSQAPLYNVANVNGQQQAAFQVPCDVTPADSVPVTVTANGNATTVNVAVRPAGPGIFEYTDSAGLKQAVLVRPDGSIVSTANPAVAGEVLHLYVTGLGQVRPSLATNTAAPAGTDSVAVGTVFMAVNNSGVRVTLARRAPGQIGIDDIAFQLPSDAQSGNASIAVAVYEANVLSVSNVSTFPIR